MFDYHLPAERIAQRALEDRTASKMLLSHRNALDQPPIDSSVRELPKFLEPGDVLVLNNSKVLPCRFFAEKQGSDAQIEVLLLSSDPDDPSLWECLARPMKRLKTGTELKLSKSIRAVAEERVGDSGERIRLRLSPEPSCNAPLMTLIEAEGSMPIPGYIREGRADAADRTRYQTVYSRESGSIAAPTAGLHFTPELLEQLKHQGVDVRFITLHVGVASFAPVRDLKTHQMPREWYKIPLATAEAIQKGKDAGKRILAVGTTTVRSLESSFKAGTFGRSEELEATELFITPGFQFQVVQSLMTNFHQPKTTHLLLVSAFLTEERVKELYKHALESDYRFLSYGDSMLIL